MSGVNVDITADTSSLDSGVNSATNSLERLRGGITSAASTMATMGAAAVAAGGALVVGLAAAGLENVDALKKMADQLGGTVSGLQALEGAAGDAGVSAGAIAGAMEKMNLKIGDALAGNKEAAKSFTNLGLSAQELSGMDVDERMAAVSDAVAGLGLSTSETAAALADMGIKQQEIVNLVRQGGDAIREESGVLDKLGVSVSQIDAKKIEEANRAMGIFGDILAGAQNRMAVELAPLLSAISAMLEEMATEGGGMGEIISSAFSDIVDAAAFVMNAGDGIGRVFSMAFNGLVAGITFVYDKFMWVFEGIFETLNKIPGMDFSETLSNINSVRLTLEETKNGAIKNFNEALNEPLAGDKFKAFAAEAKATMDTMQADEVAATKATRATISEEDEKAAQKKREEMQKRLEEMRVGLLTEAQLIVEQHAKDQEFLIAALNAKEITQIEYNERAKAIKAAHEAALGDIEKQAAAKLAAEKDKIDAKAKADENARIQERKRVQTEAMQGLTTLMNSESRKMFEVGKAAAIVNALISTKEGMTKALGQGGMFGWAAAAAIGAAGLANVQSIRSQSFGGGGGGGGMSNTQQVNAATTPVASSSGGGGEYSGTYRFEGLGAGSFTSSESVVEALKQAQKDGAIRGNIVFA
jgi:hypothetical protein